MRFLSYYLAATLLTAACSSAVIGQTNAPAVSSVAETASSQGTGLTGTWDAITRSQGGIGSTALFLPDSSVALVLGAMVDARYKVKGDTFTVYSDEPGKKFSESRTVMVAGDTAIFSSDGQVEKQVRLRTGKLASGLVGTWRFTHMTGIPAYEEYTEDGWVHLRVPMQVMKGSYSVTGDKIRFRILTPRRENSEAEFAIRGDTLSVGLGADKQLYLRARPLIPYEVQQPVLPSPVVR
jgi:hypothetical protein